MKIKTLMLCLSFIAPLPAFALELADYDIVDLTHTYDENTLFWPTSPTHFEKQTLSYGKSAGGWFYSAFSVCTPEHGGTHLDAPLHFAESGDSVEAIPLNKLVTAVVVIDVQQKAQADRDYRLTEADVLAFEKRYGHIPAGSTILMRTGWSQFWPEAKAYLGDDTPGDASRLSFPSFGADAAKLLIEKRGVVVLGVDTASIDYGKSKDFPVHRLAGEFNVPGLENLTGLESLPPTGAILLALPMKIGGGSGGPTRVLALVPK